MRLQGLMLFAGVAGILLLGAVWGCGEPEKPVVPVESEPAASAEAAASPEVRKALLDAAGCLPADSVVVGAIRSPRDLVDGIDACFGPLPATIPALALSQLPPGALDMEGPLVWASVIGEEGPGLVLVMRVADAERLDGEDLGDGIVRPHATTPLCVLRQGEWAILSLSPAPLAALKQSADRFVPDPAAADRLGRSLAWMRIDMKRIAAVAAGPLQMMERQLSGGPDNDTKARRLAAIQWAQGAIQEIETLEMALSMGEDGLNVQTRATLREGGGLVAMAKCFKPIETYAVGLPSTENLLAAQWVRADVAGLISQMKAFCDPLMQVLMAELQDVQPGDPAAALAKAAGQAIQNFWAATEKVAPAFGERMAAMAEAPAPGAGLYCQTSIIEIKDAAAYAAFCRDQAASLNQLYEAILDAMPQGPGAPKMKMNVEHQEAAETIEGVPVDLWRFHFNIEAAAESMPPEMAARMLDSQRAIINAIYGPQGIVVRTAVVQDRAIWTVGPADLMARAIQNLRAGGNLATQPKVAAALGRAPKDSCAVWMVSLPVYLYAIGTTTESALASALPGGDDEGTGDVPLPRLVQPSLSDMAVVSMRLDGRDVVLNMDVPASELSATAPIAMRVYSRICFTVFQSTMRTITEIQKQMERSMHEDGPWFPDPSDSTFGDPDETPGDPETAFNRAFYEWRAQHVVEAMADGRFDEVAAFCAESERALLSADNLQAMWNSATADAGALLEITPPERMSDSPQERIVDVTCQFERRLVVVRVGFNGDGEIAALWVPTHQARPRS